jgi:TatD DNase family protein
MLVDSHAHVNFHAYKDDAKETIQRALDAGVSVVNIGSQIDTSRQSVELANQFESDVYAVVGLHPDHTYPQQVEEEGVHFKSREEVFDYEIYKQLAQDKKVVGIGECGLDYYRFPSGEAESGKWDGVKERQKETFRLQIKLAKELDKALVIHSRPAKGDESLYDDLLAILDNEMGSLTTDPLALSPELKFEIHSYTHSTPTEVSAQGKTMNLRFEIHSFTGSPEYLQKFLDRGAYVSFNGIITFDKTGNMEKLVQMVPLERMLLETDCPFLTPIPNRGKRNEPAYVSYVAEKVAQIKNATLEEVATRTSQNAQALFKIGIR